MILWQHAVPFDRKDGICFFVCVVYEYKPARLHGNVAETKAVAGGCGHFRDPDKAGALCETAVPVFRFLMQDVGQHAAYDALA